MLSNGADVGVRYDPLLHLQFPVLKNSGTAVISPGFASHKNAFYGDHKVMEVDIKKFVVPSESLNAIGVIKDKHLAFRKEHGYGVNHWLRSCGAWDEVSIVMGLEMTYSCLTRNFKVMSINSKSKWYLKLLDKTKFLKKIDIGNPINSDLVGLSWKYIVLGNFDWKRFSEALSLVSTLHLSKISSYKDDTAVQKFIDVLRRYKAYCKESSVTNHLFAVTVPAACHDLKTNHFNLFQALVLKIKSNPEPHICKCVRKVACRFFLLKGVTPDFGYLAIHDQQSKRPLKFMHRRSQSEFIHFFLRGAEKKMMISSNITGLFDHCTSLSKKEWLLSVQNGFIVLNFAHGKSLFNTMDHKGTKVSTATQGEIALSFFTFVVPSSCVTSGDSFELLQNFVVHNARDDKLQDNLAYVIDISILESANHLTSHDESYNGNDNNASAE